MIFYIYKGGDSVKKIDATVLHETRFVAIWVTLLSAAMEAVFLVIGEWDYTVLLGNLLSGVAVILNFLLMGITVQNAVEKEEKDAKATMKASQSLRLLFLMVIAVLGATLPCFNLWAVLIPFIFPRIAVGVRLLLDKNKKSEEVTEK